MQSLPVELHAHIFVDSLPHEPYVGPSINCSPLLLLRVCRTWRDVALHTPELWSSLDTTIGEELGFQGSEETDLYRAWLSRAGARPLSLALVFAGCDWFRNDRMEVIRSYSHRFERLRIVDVSCLEVDTLLEHCCLLKHLVIEARYGEDGRSLSVAQPHPKLHTLALDSLLVTPASLPQVSWKNLTRLGVRLPEDVVYEAAVFLTLLEQCPRLETLIFGPITATSPPDHSRLHPTLRAISIVFEGLEVEENPVPMLILPGMAFFEVLAEFEEPLEEALTCHEEYTRSTDRYSASAGVAERACSLRLRGSDACFGMIDPGWATVTHLKMEVSGDTDALGKILTGCPSLQELVVTGSQCTPRSTSLREPFTHDQLTSLHVVVGVELGNLLWEATFPVLRALTIRTAYYGDPRDLLDFLARSKCPLESLWVTGRFSSTWTEGEKAELRRLVPFIDPQNLTI